MRKRRCDVADAAKPPGARASPERSPRELTPAHHPGHQWRSEEPSHKKRGSVSYREALAVKIDESRPFRFYKITQLIVRITKPPPSHPSTLLARSVARQENPCRPIANKVSPCIRYHCLPGSQPAGEERMGCTTPCSVNNASLFPGVPPVLQNQPGSRSVASPLLP